MEEYYSYFNFSMNDDVYDMLEKIFNYGYSITFDNNNLKERCTNYIKYQRSYDEIKLSVLIDEMDYENVPLNKFTFTLSLKTSSF
uniref:Ankyrin repeat protein n=1 Tax=Strongyloides venezuelensis TaxID=75913 RepID=A0A0K0EU56_STRVS